MSLQRVRFADLVALPSRDEIRAKRAAEQAAQAASVEGRMDDLIGTESLRIELLRSNSLPEKGDCPPQSKGVADEPTQSPSESLRTESLHSNSVRSIPLPSHTPTVDVPGAGRRRYYRCTLVQDGHTSGEDRLFNTMVRLVKRKGQVLSDGSWLLSISMDDLAEAAAMHRTNVRNNLKGLVAKLA